jgi:hypothetical protein
MKTEPSRNPEANLVPSGDMSNAVIRWGWMELDLENLWIEVL